MTVDVKPTIAWLGTQRFKQEAFAVLQELGVNGAIGMITAGWEERESDLEEFHSHLKGNGVAIPLYAWIEAALSKNTALSEAWYERNQTVHAIRKIYQSRLNYALEPALELVRQAQTKDFIRQATHSAIRTVRNMDRFYLKQVGQVQDRFDREWSSETCAERAEVQAKFQEKLQACEGLAMAGGHVGVLHRCLRFAGFSNQVQLPIAAWGAGAMVLAERILLFHDFPPQGAGNPEWLDHGFALVNGAIALPHPKHRLDYQNAARLTLLARRASPATAYGLEPGSKVLFSQNQADFNGNTTRISLSGVVKRGAAA